MSGPGWPTPFGIAAGFVTVIAGSLVATVFPEPATTQRLLVLALVIAGFSAIVRDSTAAIVTAGMAWPFYLGFLVDRYGELHWHSSVDLLRLGALRGAAVAGTAVGRWGGRAAVPGPAVTNLARTCKWDGGGQ